MTYRKFVDINELIAHVKANQYVCYHAPMDHAPCSVKIRQYTISNESFERSSVSLWTKETGTFKAKLTEHFDRFRVRDIGRVP